MQHIDTVTTIVPVVDENDIPRQLAKIAERDEDLRVRARQGYQLTHTASMAGPTSPRSSTPLPTTAGSDKAAGTKSKLVPAARITLPQPTPERTGTTMTTTIVPTKAVAALLRKELRTRFPGVKFSVRCSTGTAAAWINVHHEDGPTSAQVDEICGKYEGRSFDGMTDTYTDHGTTLVAGEPGEMPTEIQYGCDGINTSRDFTANGHLVAQRLIQESSNMPHLILCDDTGTLAPGRDMTGGQGCEFNDGHHAWDRPQLSPWSAVRFLLHHVDLTPAAARR